MMGEARSGPLRRSFVWPLLLSWAAFAISWAILSWRYSVHLDLFPVPRTGIVSMNVVAFLLYAPPLLLLLIGLGALRKDGPASRTLHILGWVLAASLVVASALAAFHFTIG